jgi:hypothetical protein
MAKFANEPTTFVNMSRQKRAKEKEGTQVFILAFATPPSGSESSYGRGGPTKDSIKFATGLQDEEDVDEEGTQDDDLKTVHKMNSRRGGEDRSVRAVATPQRRQVQPS